MRPIFEGQLKQKRAIREHALGLRKLVAEAGLNYEDIKKMYPTEVSDVTEVSDTRRETLKSRLNEASDKDLSLIHI